MDKILKQNIILSLLSIFVLFFLYEVKNILLPFILGALIAYLLGNLTSILEKKIGSRKMVSISLVSIFFILLLLFFAFVIPILVDQTSKLIVEFANYITKNSDILGDKITKVMSYLQIDTSELNIKAYIANYSKSVAGYSMSLLNGLLSTSIAFISLISLLIITPITAYYFLIEWNNIIKCISSYIPQNKQ
ncbi:MAG: AI-2E family transporter [Rickettsiales bacterium]|nr:AI-2E family transporter [Rickettsiales bacterium]